MSIDRRGERGVGDIRPAGERHSSSLLTVTSPMSVGREGGGAVWRACGRGGRRGVVGASFVGESLCESLVDFV